MHNILHVMHYENFDCSEQCSEFARLRWDEHEGVLAICGALGGTTVGDCCCDISCLVVAGVGVDGWTLGLLAKQPIESREDEGSFLKRMPHGILISIGHEFKESLPSKKVGVILNHFSPSTFTFNVTHHFSGWLISVDIVRKRRYFPLTS